MAYRQFIVVCVLFTGFGSIALGWAAVGLVQWKLCFNLLFIYLIFVPWTRSKSLDTKHWIKTIFPLSSEEKRQTIGKKRNHLCFLAMHPAHNYEPCLRFNPCMLECSLAYVRSLAANRKEVTKCFSPMPNVCVHVVYWCMCVYGEEFMNAPCHHAHMHHLSRGEKARGVIYTHTSTHTLEPSVQLRNATRGTDKSMILVKCGVNESAASFRTWVMIAPIERFDTFFVVCGKGFPFDFNEIFLNIVSIVIFLNFDNIHSTCM